LNDVAPVEADDDAALMATFVATRDRRVYTVLFDRHHRSIFRHVQRYVRSAAKAEELTQDVFIRVYRAKQYEPKTKFRTWLYRVATNVCLNELRRPEQKEKFDALDDVSPAADGPNPETAHAGKEIASKVEAALDRLPPNQRAAFLMARQDQLSHEEIAAALETSVSAVKSLIHRALEALRKELASLELEQEQSR
jgi:RNA polymerase sigma-70 factor, ECF subfamily